MEHQTEIPEIKEIEEQQVPEVEPVIARTKSDYILALELIRGEKDPRYYLNGINVKPHPVLPGVLLTATNGHMAMIIHDDQGFASREFTLETSKQLINCCKIKGTLIGSEWVEINGREISVVQREKYIEFEQCHLPEVEKPLVDHVNGIFSFDEVDGDSPYPDVASRLIPDLSEYKKLEGGCIGFNADYLYKLKKAFLAASGLKEVYLRLSFKDVESAIYVSAGLDNISAVMMPHRVDDYDVELPGFISTLKGLNGVPEKADKVEEVANPFFNDEGKDVFQDEAVAFVKETRKASVSAIQRKFRIGYNRAARIIEQMEYDGLVSTPGHNGAREVLVPADE